MTMLVACTVTGCATHHAPLRRDTATPNVTRPAFAYSAPAPTIPAEPMRENVREIVLRALSFIGTPYRNGGTSPVSGFDCSGLVYYVVTQGAGVAVPRDTSRLSQVGADVSSEELRPGDLVFFNTLGKPYSHVGIYLGGQRFIHAPTEGGTVGVVDMRLPYWTQRYDGARRLDL